MSLVVISLGVRRYICTYRYLGMIFRMYIVLREMHERVLVTIYSLQGRKRLPSFDRQRDWGIDQIGTVVP